MRFFAQLKSRGGGGGSNQHIHFFKRLLKIGMIKA